MPAPLLSAAAAAGALLGGAMYLDGRFALRNDIKQLLHDRRYGKRLAARCRQLGEYATLYHILELADMEAEAVWFEGRRWTYSQMKEEVDGLAEILHRHGVGAGDFVAVYMTNSPEMVFTIYALAKLGAVPALLNTALTNQTLDHCLQVANASIIISTADLTERLPSSVGGSSTTKLCLSLSLGSFPTAPPIPPDPGFILVTSGAVASAVENTQLSKARRSLKDIGVLIYTSGTSGKPKAVSVKNMQLAIVSTPLSIDAAHAARYLSPLRIYSCLPLFHATCLFTGLCYAAGARGGTFCVARKFSASGFSHALADSGATRLLYVGELCRYALKAPPSEWDRRHVCRVAMGNGLQRDVWEEFVRRFGLDEVREFYRSTEGIARFDNVNRGGKAGVGKIGFAGPLAKRSIRHTYIVRYDPETEAPWRDPNTGLCAEARHGEPGEALGRVEMMDFYSDYLNNQEANEKKLIHDVFEKGDVFQRSGDLLMRDKHGWVHFMDRSGDTFRWRGENVSTGEVRDHISQLPGVVDATVFGIKLIGYDGQAGVAAITLDNRSQAAEAAFAGQLYKRLRDQGLTMYQIPRLIRFLPQIEVNATFKHAKTVLKTRPWDPEMLDKGETAWWLDGEEYRRLDAVSWADIRAARARL